MGSHESWVLVGRERDPENASGFLSPHFWEVRDADGTCLATFPHLIPEAQARQAHAALLMVHAAHMYDLLKRGLIYDGGSEPWLKEVRDLLEDEIDVDEESSG